MKQRLALGILLSAAMLLMVPTVASAQSAIVGLLTDDSGGVLPGVTVEAFSAVMIEGSRTTFTDSQGRFRIPELRPGTYKLTFSLTGFGTVVREGVPLPSAFVATVNVEMKVGSLEETISVSGTAPQVDVQQASRTTVIAAGVRPGTSAQSCRAIRDWNEPGSLFWDRWNQLDINVKKNFRHNNKVLTLQVDVFNVLNSNAIRAGTNNVGTDLGRATTIMVGRFPRLALNHKF